MAPTHGYMQSLAFCRWRSAEIAVCTADAALVLILICLLTVHTFPTTCRYISLSKSRRQSGTRGHASLLFLEHLHIWCAQSALRYCIHSSGLCVCVKISCPLPTTAHPSHMSEKVVTVILTRCLDYCEILLHRCTL